MKEKVTIFSMIGQAFVAAAFPDADQASGIPEFRLLAARRFVLDNELTMTEL